MVRGMVSAGGVEVWRRNLGSAQVHRCFQCLFDRSQDRSRQGPGPLRQFRPVNRCDLMAHRHARLRQHIAAGKLDDGRTPRRLSRGCRHRDDDDRPPADGLVKRVVRDDDDGTVSRLLGSRSRTEIGPVDVTPPQSGCSISARCSRDACSRSTSSSEPVPAFCSAKVAISA